MSQGFVVGGGGRGKETTNEMVAHADYHKMQSTENNRMMSMEDLPNSETNMAINKPIIKIQKTATENRNIFED